MHSFLVEQLTDDISLVKQCYWARGLVLIPKCLLILSIIPQDVVGLVRCVAQSLMNKAFREFGSIDHMLTYLTRSTTPSLRSRLVMPAPQPTGTMKVALLRSWRTRILLLQSLPRRRPTFHLLLGDVLRKRIDHWLCPKNLVIVILVLSMRPWILPKRHGRLQRDKP